MDIARSSAALHIGPKSDAMLASIGIHTHADLEHVGAVDAYAALKRAGQPVNLNLLWAMEGILSNRYLVQVAINDGARMLAELEQRGVKA